MEQINPPTRSMEITEAAVEAALDVVMDDGHNGIECKPDRNLAVTMRAALEAALPYLAPAGDGGLREVVRDCPENPGGGHNKVTALNGDGESLGYLHCGYCGER